jgi:hypothetical protein
MYVFLNNLNNTNPPNNTNNSVLTGIKAMPLKDGVSDGTASFSTARHEYAEVFNTYNNTVDQKLRKKWQGGTRDASDVASKRRIQSIGQSLNGVNLGIDPISFVSSTEKNTRIQALNRVRNKGYRVPSKVSVSPYHVNVPISRSLPVSITSKHPLRSENHAVLGNHAPWKYQYNSS